MSERVSSTTDPDAGNSSQFDFARTTRALRILRSANRALIHSVDEDALLQEVCRIAVDEGGYRLAMVAFAEQDETRTWRPVAYSGAEAGFIRPATVSWSEESEYGRGPGGTAIRTGRPSIARDIMHDPNCARWRQQAIQRGYRSVVALPLKSEGLAFGVLAIHSSEVDAFDADEVAILDELASNLATGIVTLRDRHQHKLAQEAQRRLNRELRALSICNQTLLRAQDEQTLLGDICRIVCDEAGYRMAWVGYREFDAARTIRPVARGGVDHAFLDEVPLTWSDEGLGLGPAGTAMRTERAVFIQDIAAAPDIESWREGALRRGIRSIIALPLKDDESRTFGVFVLYSSQANAFTADETRLLDELSGDLAFGIAVLRARVERKRLEQQRLATLHYFASMDRINQAAQSTNDLEQMTSNVLDVVLSIFECDRAWLAYPCDPGTATWQVPMERTRPGVARLSSPGLELPADPEMLAMCRTVLAAQGPVTFGPGLAHPLPGDALDRFGVRSGLAMAIHPQMDQPYMFGLHQCSGPREWTADEKLLFQEIGRRLADNLTNVQMHRNLHRSEARLRDSLARVQRLVESNIIGVYFWTRAGRIMEANDAFLGLVGYDRTELLTGKLLWTEMTPPEYVDEDARATAEIRLTGTCSPYEKEYFHKDGHRVPILIGAALLDGSQEDGVAFVLDLTERKKAQSEVTARQAAEASNRAKTEFLSRMSHELRTPLNAVLGFSQLLRSEAQDRLTPQQCVQLEHIHRAGWHLLALINDVLDVSRIETGQLMVQAQALELGPLLDEALSMASPLAQPLAVTLVAQECDHLPAWVLADPIRLRQVLINLLSNAVKYNRPGGTVSVAIALSADGKQVLLDVVDDGIGMTRDQLDHLYEPFNRLGRERGGVEGTGIGLALTRQLVRLMQGQMDVDSEAGHGTRVRVALPAQPIPSASDSPSFAAAMSSPAGAPRSDAEPPSGVVLYIEDNPVNLLLVEHLLARWSAVHLVQAEDGESGIELTRSLRPDLVLLDMQLPDMDGLAVLRSLRADPQTRDLAVVALSASAMPELMAQACTEGVTAYWTKPLDCDRFVADMHRLLQPRSDASATR